MAGWVARPYLAGVRRSLSVFVRQRHNPNSVGQTTCPFFRTRETRKRFLATLQPLSLRLYSYRPISEQPNGWPV